MKKVFWVLWEEVTRRWVDTMTSVKAITWLIIRGVPGENSGVSIGRLVRWTLVFLICR